MFVKIPRQTWLWYLLALLVVALDQLSKIWACRALAYGEPMPLMPFLDFTLLHNPGAAFSFLSNAGGWQRWFFTGLAIVVSVFLVIWIARSYVNDGHVKNKRETFALTFILGGALGNLYDRIEFGYVVDFIVVHYRDYFWPAFNLADAAITLGAFIVVVEIFLTKEKKSNA